MGAIAKVDVIEAEAEVARRAEIILIADKSVANAEERLRFHIFDPLAPATDVALEPEVPAAVRPITADAAKQALAERHDLKALQTSMAIDGINIRRFRNDALPEASVRVHYGLQWHWRHGTAQSPRISRTGHRHRRTLARTRRPNFSRMLSSLM